MSKRARAWERIIEKQDVQDWLNDDKSLVYQLKTDDFSSVVSKPVEMIPSYKQSGLPKILTNKGLQLLRNQIGGCLLIKIRDSDTHTLFPKLPEPESKYCGQPLREIPRLTVLSKPDSVIMNEETGVHLGWTMGVFQAFFLELFSPFERFSFGGRLKGTARGAFRINQQRYDVQAYLEGDAYFESDNRIVVMEAKKTDYEKPLTDFSMHQILLPLVAVRSASDKPCSGMLFSFSARHQDDTTSLVFRLYHYQVLGDGVTVLPFEYRLTKSKEYRITVTC